MRSASLQPAVVIGDLNLVRCLGRVGVPVTFATAAPVLHPVSWSRYCSRTVRIPDPEDLAHDEAVADALLAIPWPGGTSPALFYQDDYDLLVVSRYRERLARRYRFVIPPAHLVESTVDKAGFLAMALRRGLPIPRTQIIRPGPDMDGQLRAWDCFPCIVKPAVRTQWFRSAISMVQSGSGPAKGIRIGSRDELERLRPMLGQHHTELIFQEYIDGGEERIVSFHAYVRPDGSCPAAFTGRKIRTFPRSLGVSSYVQITDDARVRKLGLEVVERLGFHGVLKIDFKEDPRDGRLHLLEINPRFNLWHYPAAAAGANIPALVYRDLYGLDWDLSTRARPGMRWLTLFRDLRAFPEYRRAGELTLGGWLRSLGAPSVYDGFAWNDPLPALAGYWVRAQERLRRRKPSLPAGGAVEEGAAR